MGLMQRGISGKKERESNVAKNARGRSLGGEGGAGHVTRTEASPASRQDRDGREVSRLRWVRSHVKTICM